MCGILPCDRSLHAIAILSCGVRKAANQNLSCVLYKNCRLSIQLRNSLFSLHCRVCCNCWRGRVLARAGNSQSRLDRVRCVVLPCDRSLHTIAILSCGVRKAASGNFVVSVLYVEFCLSYHTKTFFSVFRLSATRKFSFYLSITLV